MSRFRELQQAAEAGEESAPDRDRGWFCLRCRHRAFEVGELHAAGSLAGKIFDVEGERFTRVSCARCRYTEFYHAPPGRLGSLFDLFVG